VNYIIIKLNILRCQAFFVQCLMDKTALSCS